MIFNSAQQRVKNVFETLQIKAAPWDHINFGFSIL